MGMSEAERQAMLEAVMELPQNETIANFVIVAHVHEADMECTGAVRVSGTTETTGDAIMLLGCGAVCLMNTTDPDAPMSETVGD